MKQTAGEWTAGAIRAELARRKLSARSLGGAIGWSVGTTHRRVSGQSPLTVDELTAVAAYLDVPVQTLLPAPAQLAGSPAT